MRENPYFKMQSNSQNQEVKYQVLRCLQNQTIVEINDFRIMGSRIAEETRKKLFGHIF